MSNLKGAKTRRQTDNNPLRKGRQEGSDNPNRLSIHSGSGPARPTGFPLDLVPWPLWVLCGLWFVRFVAFCASITCLPRPSPLSSPLTREIHPSKPIPTHHTTHPPPRHLADIIPPSHLVSSVSPLTNTALISHCIGISPPLAISRRERATTFSIIHSISHDTARSHSAANGKLVNCRPDRGSRTSIKAFYPITYPKHASSSSSHPHPSDLHDPTTRPRDLSVHRLVKVEGARGS